MSTHYSIGEFSKLTGITAKTLRFYHEKGILVPALIDQESGYRFYNERSFERARVISALKRFEFSLEQISHILRDAEEDEDILEHLETQKMRMSEELERRKGVIRQIDQIINGEREQARLSEASADRVEEKVVDPCLVVGLRMKGRYSECGQVFGRLARKVGRHISGKAMCLYFDGEYRETDADFEPCFPLAKAVTLDGFSVHELRASTCLSLIHSGPYDQLGRSYAKLFEVVHERKLTVELPTREIFLKGPGMIFKGNPVNYRTEIQLPIA